MTANWLRKLVQEEVSEYWVQNPPLARYLAEEQAALPPEQQHEGPYLRYYRGTVDWTHAKHSAHSTDSTLPATISVVCRETIVYCSAPYSYDICLDRNTDVPACQTTNLAYHCGPWMTMRAEIVPPVEPEEEGEAEHLQIPARFLTLQQTNPVDPNQRKHPLRHENAQLS